MQQRAWRTRLLALLALAAVCGVGLEGEARAELPCGLLDPVDALLCAGGSPPAPTASPPAPTPAPPDTGGSEASPAGPASVGVRRTGVKPELVPDLRHVRFVARTGRAKRAGVLAAAGASEERTIRQLGVTVAHVPPDRLEAARSSLERSRWVKSVERDVVVHGIGGRARLVPARSQRPSAVGPLAQGATQVAVLDTGVDPSHPDLAGVVLPGFDFVNNDQDAADDHWHGTAVAGVLAGRASQARGTCSNCTVLPVKVLAADGTGDTSGVAAGIVYAVNRGARVINLSLGSPGTTQALDDAVAYAASRNVLVVAAAGNDGVSTPFYPAAHAQSLSVAGITSSDRLYPWSNFGEWVAVAALGCRPAPVPGGYAQFCGTSASAPVVSGLAGGIISSRPATTATEVAQALESTALPIGPGRPLRPRPTGRGSRHAHAGAGAPHHHTSRHARCPAALADLRARGRCRAFPGNASVRRSLAARPLAARRCRRHDLEDDRPVTARDLEHARRRTYRLVVSGTRARARYTVVVSHV